MSKVWLNGVDTMGRWIVVLLAVGMLLSAGIAVGQEGNAPLELTAEDVREDELRAFAAATVEADRIREKWQPRIDSADTLEEGNEIRNEAAKELAKVVENSGLPVLRYNAIFRLMHRNPEIASAISKYRREVKVAD